MPTGRSHTNDPDNICRDEWATWQQGNCGTYATALMAIDPTLRFGGVDFDNDPGYDNPSHYVAHDDRYAYDSAGRHPLPYQGICGTGRWLPDLGDPAHYGIPNEEPGCHTNPDAVLEAATNHITRNNILTRTPTRPGPR